MKILAKLVSVIGLGLTVVPAYLVWSGSMTWDSHASLMLLGTVLWFGSAPLWMRKEGAGG